METIKKGTTQTESVLTLQRFLQALGYPIAVDGGFGPKTEAIVKQFQAENGLVVDGIVGPKGWQKLFSLKPELLAEISKRFLSENDLQALAAKFNLELAAVKAVNEVESGGTGFIGDKPKILFEGHIFWQQLEAAGIDPNSHTAGNETILFKNATSAFYRGGLEEYKRLEAAKLIHENAALESASWGLFQILGKHWKPLGYASITEFVALMHQNEGAHLDAFGRFLEVARLIDELRNKEWTKFARGYNGPGFRKNKYDEKLAAAYEKYKN